MVKICVLGKGRHGKDTVCELLRDFAGLTFESSSKICSSFVFEDLRDKYGYASIEECYNDRHNHRKEWHDLISNFNGKDPARLTKLILSHNDIYCGLRSKRELDAASGLFDLIIWVSANERVGSDTESSDSITVTKDDADIIIENNGSVEDLRLKIYKLQRLINTRKT